MSLSNLNIYTIHLNYYYSHYNSDYTIYFYSKNICIQYYLYPASGRTVELWTLRNGAAIPTVLDWVRIRMREKWRPLSPSASGLAQGIILIKNIWRPRQL